MANQKYVVLVAVVAVVVALGAAALLVPDLNRVSTTTATISLPQGCDKPARGFLIVASQFGYNNSVDHGVPQNSWPVMNVRQGQNVTIVVCNADPAQSHGFQIDHYYNAQLVSIAPGTVLKVSFIADETGTFRVYCQLPCSIHWAMQSGELVVS